MGYFSINCLPNHRNEYNHYTFTVIYLDNLHFISERFF